MPKPSRHPDSAIQSSRQHCFKSLCKHFLHPCSLVNLLCGTLSQSWQPSCAQVITRMPVRPYSPRGGDLPFTPVVSVSLFFNWFISFIFGCAWTFSRCGEWGLLSCCRARASGVAARGLSSWGTQAELCKPPPPTHTTRVESSPTRDRTHVPCTAGGFSTTGPPGKSSVWLLTGLPLSRRSVPVWIIICMSF